MATLLNSDIISVFTGAFMDHFDTFTHDRTRLITIYKEPIKTIATTNRINPIYGYEDSSATSNVTYTPVTGIFPATIKYDSIQKTQELEEVKNTINKGEVRIKIEQNARDFIEDGRKNERFEFDGLSYNQITNDGVQNYLGLVFYIYKLQRTS